MNSETSEMLYAVKMRASLGGTHISGAERIVPPAEIPRTLSALASRAIAHSRGVPDEIHLKAEALSDILRIPSLRVETCEVATPAQGWQRACALLREEGVARADEICARFCETYPMRGAMILDADTLERLDDKGERGVRATNMDSCPHSPPEKKNHFAEALVLASKVLSAPGIIAEICMSDDPEYTTGYVATRGRGYSRITRLKERGDEAGGRIFLYRGRREDIPRTIEYLEHRSVIVELGGAGGGAGGAGADNAGAKGYALLEQELKRIEHSGLRRTIRTVEERSGATMTLGGARLVSFASNDYLGYAADERVAKAAAEAVLRYGAGSGASRLVSGTLEPHIRLEKHLAAFKLAEDAIVFASGYMANLGIITALVGKGDVVFSDSLNHASIIDACRLSGAHIEIYPHADLAELDRRLSRWRSSRTRLVVSDGVFSMDGDMLDLPRFLEICRRHDAFSMVDEAHSLGVEGAHGRGLGEHFGCGAPDFMMGTLSKALGSSGGYVAGKKLAIEYLRQKSRPFIFSTASDIAAVAAADKALSLLEEEPWRVSRLRENANFFAAELARHGIRAATHSAIVPILVGEETRSSEISAALEREGFWIPAIRYPTVARGSARLRAAISCLHTRSDLAAAAHSLGKLF